MIIATAPKTCTQKPHPSGGASIGQRFDATNFINQKWADTYGAKLLAPAQVKGLYCQRGPFGKIYAGPKNEPVITRRTGMNIAGDPNKMARFIKTVNAYQPSPHTEDGYSVIQVNLEESKIQDCQELSRKLGPAHSSGDPGGTAL